nr:MAG TPA: hypothetical protein [Caudoviricetes sp.]
MLLRDEGFPVAPQGTRGTDLRRLSGHRIEGNP